MSSISRERLSSSSSDESDSVGTQSTLSLDLEASGSDESEDLNPQSYHSSCTLRIGDPMCFYDNPRPWYDVPSFSSSKCSASAVTHRAAAGLDEGEGGDLSEPDSWEKIILSARSVSQASKAAPQKPPRTFQHTLLDLAAPLRSAKMRKKSAAGGSPATTTPSTHERCLAMAGGARDDQPQRPGAGEASGGDKTLCGYLFSPVDDQLLFPSRPRPSQKFRRPGRWSSPEDGGGCFADYEEMSGDTTSARSGSSLEEERDRPGDGGRGGFPLSKVPRKIGEIKKRLSRRVSSTATNSLAGMKELSASMLNVLESVSSGVKNAAVRPKKKKSRPSPRDGVSEGEVTLRAMILNRGEGPEVEIIKIFLEGPMGVGKSSILANMADLGGANVVAFKEGMGYVRSVYGDALKDIYGASKHTGKKASSRKLFCAQSKFLCAARAVAALIDRHSLGEHDRPQFERARWCLCDIHRLSICSVYPLTMVRLGLMHFEHFSSLVSHFSCGEGEVVVLLDSSASSLRRHVKARGRAGEGGVSLSYLQELVMSFHAVRQTWALLGQVSAEELVKFCFCNYSARDLFETNRGALTDMGVTYPVFKKQVSESMLELVKSLVATFSGDAVLMMTWLKFFTELKKLKIVSVHVGEFEGDIESACAAVYRALAVEKSGIKTTKVNWTALKLAAATFNGQQ